MIAKDCIFEFGAVQRNANLVDLEICCKTEYLVAKIGVDSEENEPLQVWRMIQISVHFTPSSQLNY